MTRKNKAIENELHRFFEAETDSEELELLRKAIALELSILASSEKGCLSSAQFRMSLSRLADMRKRAFELQQNLR